MQLSEIAFGKAQAMLANALLKHEAEDGCRPDFGGSSATSYDRMRKGEGNPTLKSMVEVLAPLGLELRIERRG